MFGEYMLSGAKQKFLFINMLVGIFHFNRLYLIICFEICGIPFPAWSSLLVHPQMALLHESPAEPGDPFP